MNQNKIARKGVPDILKRPAILKNFELTSETCRLNFQAMYDSTNIEELEIAQEDLPSKPFIYTSVLTDKGLKNLETVVHFLNKEKHIEYSPIMINTVAIMLIYLPLEEAYCVTQKMMDKSSKLLGDPNTKKLMRWYFCFTKADYSGVISTFIQSYIDTTKFKSRSVLIRLRQIGYDITDLLDEMFKYFFTSFHRTDRILDIFTFYVFEGVKILYRFAYSSMKVHKSIIKGVDDPDKIRDTFQTACYNDTDWKYLYQRAFKYRISRSYYDINKTESIVLQEEREEYKIVSEFLPQTDECPSSILSLKQFYRLWMMLPEYCQIRIPKKIYSSYTDGFLLSTLYMKCNKFKELTSVKCVFMIIKTLDGDIFGTFLDTVITKTIKSYIGSTDSFLFGFYSDKRAQYFSQRVNSQYCIGGDDYIQIGGGADGPAIRLNDTLQEGQTNPCETFASPKLTSTEDTFFAVKSLEIILL